MAYKDILIVREFKEKKSYASNRFQSHKKQRINFPSLKDQVTQTCKKDRQKKGKKWKTKRKELSSQTKTKVN